MTNDNRLVLANEFIRDHPKATVREIMKASGYSSTKASQLKAANARKLATLLHTEVTEDGVPLVEVKKVEPPEKPKQSFLEKTWSKVSSSDTPKPRRKTASQDNGLVASLLPTMVAGFVATYAKDMLPEEYAMCAPSSEEVGAIVGPLFAILNRHVQVFAKASADTTDIINAVLASMAYSMRAFITYKKISKEIANGQPKPTEEWDTPTEYGLRAYQGTSTRTSNGSVGIPQVSANGLPAESDAILDAAASNSDSSELRRYEAAQIDSLFHRDREGRSKLGLYR